MKISIKELKIEMNPPSIWISLVGLFFGLVMWVAQSPKAQELIYELALKLI